MLLHWNERKRQANLQAHGLDFADAFRVFRGPTYTYEDDRFDYGERSYVTLGWLDGEVVSIVYAESKVIRIISFRRLRDMSKKRTSVKSKTDWVRFHRMTDRDITITPEHPELDEKHIIRGIVHRGLQPIAPKVAISLRLDADVLEWLKAKGPGYQTRINAILRAFKDASVAR